LNRGGLAEYWGHGRKRKANIAFRVKKSGMEGYVACLWLSSWVLHPSEKEALLASSGKRNLDFTIPVPIRLTRPANMHFLSKGGGSLKLHANQFLPDTIDIPAQSQHKEPPMFLKAYPT